MKVVCLRRVWSQQNNEIVLFVLSQKNNPIFQAGESSKRIFPLPASLTCLALPTLRAAVRLAHLPMAKMITPLADGGGDASLFGELTSAATGTLAQLLVVATLVSFVLTHTSGNALANLPVALLAVWAVRCLAQVRFDARWDAGTRRFSLSVTRQGDQNTDAAASGGSSPKPKSKTLDGTPLLAPAPRPPIRAGGADNRERPAAGAGASAGADGTGKTVARVVAPWQPSEQEVELRELLRRLEQGGDGSGGNNDAASAASAASSSASNDGSHNGGASSPKGGGKEKGVVVARGGLLGAWGRLRDHIVDEFVTGLWYRSITEDDDLPLALRRLLDASFAELAHRARAVVGAEKVESS